MTADLSGIRDEIAMTLDRACGHATSIGLRGDVEIAVTRPRRSAAGLEVVHFEVVPNMVTQIGDQYYGERAAAGITGSPLSAGPANVTGMRLGTSTTAAAKTSTGSFIVTYITGSNQVIESGYPTSALNGASRRINWRSVWAAGDSTNAAITEAAITNEGTAPPTGPTDVQGTAANTIARVVFTAVDKGALDTLTITWSHDLLGA